MNWFVGKKRILLISLSRKIQILNDKPHMSDGWSVQAIAINWEDCELRCDHCGEAIPSAYGET